MSAFTMPSSEENLQHFLHLQFQHALLSSHLCAIRPSASLPSSVSPSPPTHTIPLRRHSRRSSLASNSNDDSESSLSLADDERRLSEVNEDIKRTLTALLNCEDVRSDSGRRMWVQSRLMEAERELRSGRRRRSAASVDA